MRPVTWITNDGRRVLLSKMHPVHLNFVWERMERIKQFRPKQRDMVKVEIEARKILGPPYEVDRNPK